MTMTPPEYSQHPATPAAQVPQPPNSAAFPPAYAPEKPFPVHTRVSDTNTYALVAVILAFIVPIAGIIFGHLGLNQIKRTGDAGRGLALTALIYGYSVFALGALFFISYIGLIFMAIGTFSNMGNF